MEGYNKKKPGWRREIPAPPHYGGLDPPGRMRQHARVFDEGRLSRRALRRYARRNNSESPKSRPDSPMSDVAGFGIGPEGFECEWRDGPLRGRVRPVPPLAVGSKTERAYLLTVIDGINLMAVSTEYYGTLPAAMLSCIRHMTAGHKDG